ncbi:Putative peptidoglycan binding domain-containing protein [Rhizobiales bacterium GAS191]|nr:Putative peptidoglycan binding domain-containing protein [Rhizobiales bacterium GAS191]
MRALLGLLAVLFALISAPASAQLRPPGYFDAAERFQAMAVPDRVGLELLLTAAGYWPAVPTENFNGRLFEAISRFQTESGFPTTGYLTSDQTSRLTRLAQPVIDALGLRAVSHPDRGHPLWVPMGLGLVATRTPRGLSFNDPLNRLKIDYEFYQGLPLGRSYAMWTERLLNSGAQIGYKFTRSDFFAIVGERGDQSWYVRFHQDGDGILGFSLTYRNTDPSVHGFPLQTLMSASMWSVMSPGAVSLPMPQMTIAASLPPLAPPVTSPPVTANATPPASVARADPAPGQTPSRKESSGTGFFVSAQGHVLTNAHVVNGCSSIQVPGPNGLTSVRLIAKDQTNDLALLKSDLSPTKFAQLRTGVRLGESVAAFGYPLLGVLSTTGNFTLGNVTSLTGLNDDTRYLQISTPVQPGNSGGPLLDASGNFVGVVSAKLDALLVMVATNGDIPQNVNFAIKSSVAATFLESNGVSFSAGVPGPTIAPADLADQAKAISMPVLCK